VKFGVIRFPGTCDDVDAQLAAARVGEAELLWHRDRDLKGVDAVVVPGGFSYGDYLRAGAIARFAPVMESVCNGFQILCEAGLLPGALLVNDHLKFVFRQVQLDVVDPNTPFTRNSPPTLSIPVKHTTGRYYSSEPVQVVLKYSHGNNPNGSQDDIAGVVNNAGNVFGLMPHPEHAVDPLTGSADGLTIFESIRAAVGERVPAV
jgi:phosphoribosylformylglycinamidine synthase